MKPKQAIKVFITYAQEDEAAKKELCKHLDSMQKEGLLTIWDKTQILPGDDWKTQVAQKLADAQIILLLISADAIASEIVYTTEIEPALAQHQANAAVVIPVLLRPYGWTLLETEDLLALPYSNQPKPISRWTNQDAAYQHIAQNIRLTALHWQEIKAGKSLSTIWQKVDEKQDKPIVKLPKLQIAASIGTLIIATIAVVKFCGIELLPTTPSEFSQTVLLRQGKTPFENKGEVMLTYGGEQESLPIGDGKVSFPIENYQADSAYFTLQGINDYELHYPDSNYILSEKAITLQLKVKKQLLTIEGSVVDAKTLQALVGASISVVGEQLVTDSLGRFYTELTLEKTKQSYALTARKEGYRPSSLFYNPKSKSDPIRLKKLP